MTVTTTTEHRKHRAAPRLPAQPLFDRIARDCGAPHGGLKLVARATGVNPSVVRKWRDQGLTIWHADRLAVRIGAMPHEVWGSGWARAIGTGLGRGIPYDDATARWVNGDG